MIKDIEHAETISDMALFRAKRLDTRDWIEGCLITRPNGLNANRAYIIPEVSSVQYSIGKLQFGGFIEVDPKTVCRFTGLFDKNKKRIYEKDIVMNHMGFRQVVQYYMGAFVFRSELDFIYKEWQGETFCACQKKFSDEEQWITADEVVGNIFDDEQFRNEMEEANNEL